MKEFVKGYRIEIADNCDAVGFLEESIHLIYAIIVEIKSEDI